MNQTYNDKIMFSHHFPLCAILFIIFEDLILYPKIVQVKIVIVDSVTFHFRQDFEDLALRTRLLSGMALKLMNLAKTYNLAVSRRLLHSIICNRLVNVLPT